MIRFLLVFTGAALVALCVLFVARPVWIEDVVLAEGTKPGWVIIEYENSACEPLDKGWFRRVILVPGSGYFCTSTISDKSPLLSRYFLRRRGGTKGRLRISQWIWARASVSGPWKETAPGGKVLRSCSVEADVFWFGPRGSAKGDVHVAIRAHHPGCP